MKNIKKFIKSEIPLSLLLICLTVLPVLPAFAETAYETIYIVANRDVTLIESAKSDVANGSGPVFFAGHTNQPTFGLR